MVQLGSASMNLLFAFGDSELGSFDDFIVSKFLISPSRKVLYKPEC
jgi:hypothetical protein